VPAELHHIRVGGSRDGRRPGGDAAAPEAVNYLWRNVMLRFKPKANDSSSNSSPVRSRRTSSGQRTNRLGLESLEGRAMMAGDVWASVNGGDLVINGNDASNGIVVNQTGPTTFGVSGSWVNGATAVNGSYSTRYFSNVTGAIRVDLRGGNDVFRIGGNGEFNRNILPDDLFINGGSGNDKIDVQWLSNRDSNDRIFINAGSENDQVSLYKVVNRDFVNIDTGDGDDSVDVNYVTVGTDLNVSTQAGNDRLNVSMSHIDRLFADMGRGNDTVSIGNNWLWSDAFVNGNDGFDTMSTFNNNRTVRRNSIG
jgi:hypothetical protein